MRLIDADALKEQILDWISEQVVSKYISHDACMATREGARVAFNLLNEAPTISAVPVVRGRWRTWEEQFPDRTTRKKNNLGVFCSACQLHADNMTSYCPNCGCDMRGERDGEK